MNDYSNVKVSANTCKPCEGRTVRTGETIENIEILQNEIVLVINEIQQRFIETETKNGQNLLSGKGYIPRLSQIERTNRNILESLMKIIEIL